MLTLFGKWYFAIMVNRKYGKECLETYEAITKRVSCMEMDTKLYTREAWIFEKEHYDICSNCGRKFHNDETTHLGFDKNGNYQYVCDSCKDIIKHTIVRHVYRERCYEIPERTSILWRYMDVSKLLSLLQTKSLYLARADSFADPFEGAKGILENEDKWNGFYNGFCYGAITSAIEQGISPQQKETEIQKQAEGLFQQLKSLSDKRKSAFINCWHENQSESEAMWKLYAKDADNCIAIQTTLDKLYLSINKDPKINIGRINYIDFNKKFAAFGNDAFFYKREAFQYEHEVRLVYVELGHKTEQKMGILIPVDLNILIENIYVSPTSKPWFKSAIQNVLTIYGLKKEVKQSSLLATPFF